MSLSATVVDALSGPVPTGWDDFVAGRRLPPGWESQLLRSVGWCGPGGATMVLVSDGPEPVAAFHTTHLAGPRRRFATPGPVPGISLTDCRILPAFDSGVAFSEALSGRDRIEAARVFERALRTRTGAGGLIYYRAVSQAQAASLLIGRRLQKRLRPTMVLHNEWPDLPGYLATLPRRWKAQLQGIHDAVEADETIQVTLAGTVEPSEASWLSDVVRRRRRSGVVPFPPVPALYFARFGELSGSSYLTYRDQHGRLLAFVAMYDDGEDLWSGIWGYRSQRDGGRRNLYFDVYIRQILLMLSLGRRRLVLGPGLEEMKGRFGARPEPRWGLLGIADAGHRAAAVPPGGPGPPAAARGQAGPTVLDRLGAWAAGRGAAGGGSPVLRRAGRSPDRSRLATGCRQCGQWSSVTVVRLGASRARYWCQRCAAVVAVPDRGVLRPLAQLRQEPSTPGSAPEAATAGAQEVMPAAMWRWVSSWSRKPVTIDLLGKGRIYQLYSGWDAHLREAGPDRVAGLAADGEPPPVPGLPTFAAVVTQLNRFCYRPDLVVESLRGSLPAGKRAGEALRERAEHARRWLAVRGADLCWIHGRLSGDGLVEPDRAAVQAVVATLRAGGGLDPADRDTALAALFGTDRGPRFSTLQSVYPVDEIVTALETFLGSGERPLREDVLAKLATPLPGRAAA